MGGFRILTSDFIVLQDNKHNQKYIKTLFIGKHILRPATFFSGTDNSDYE